MSSLTDPDPVFRGLVLIAIRNTGTAARPFLNQLIEKLGDEDPNVRVKAGEAIASLGTAAVPAIPALVKACQMEGEQVPVLRSMAHALGAIGPQAQSALPVLRELKKHPRVDWEASAAIRKITGESAISPR